MKSTKNKISLILFLAGTWAKYRPVFPEAVASWETHKWSGRRTIALDAGWWACRTSISNRNGRYISLISFIISKRKRKIERVLSCYGKIVQSEVEQLGCVSLGKRIWIRIEFKKQNVFFKRNNESEKNFLPRIPYIAKAARLCADQMFHRKFNDKNCTRKETLDIQNQKLTLLDGKTVPYFR